MILTELLSEASVRGIFTGLCSGKRRSVC